MTKAEKRRLEALDDILKAGEFDSKSSMGNAFRNALKSDAKMTHSCKALSSQSAQRDFRMTWVQDARAPLAQKLSKEKRTSWSRKDTQRFRYRSFGALVQEWGGWHCEEANEEGNQ